ncbi:MFS multidrug transporter [Lepidopterella palustris CBS 459.81]|uniref:MFS multidrug transporter n=1 Tax=Lepidopterella palustris CBS 459.81 TaxID=1314670 RepID=A0A8E2ECY7_9PEZI|nr:MFS multidrug transporter [Lepidopterella palustris CBS 459.81]
MDRILPTQHLDDLSVYHHEDGGGLATAEVSTSSLHRTGTGRRQCIGNTSFEDSASSIHMTDRKRPEDDAKTESEPGDVSEKDEDRTVQEIRSGIRNERDVEAGEPRLEKQSSRSINDPNLVTWDSPNDQMNPKNWSMNRKWAATFIVSAFTLLSPMASSMVAPALGTMAKEFQITSIVKEQLILSIFVLAYAIGPLFLGPLSEIYGRVQVLQLSNLFFIAWNTGCGFAQTSNQMLVFRFFSGIGGSAPLGIGGGLLSDCFEPEQRGRAVSIYSLAPLLGPAIGPIAGGFITENTTWRWAFWATSIFGGVIQCFGFLFLQETYAPTLLKNKANKLRKETGNMALHTEYETPEKTVFNILKVSFIRPFRLLFTQPIVQVLAVYMAYLYGLMYLVLSTLPPLWNDRYHESIGIGGLNYISLGIGFFIGSQLTAPLSDRIYRKLKKRNNNTNKPEFRIPPMVPGSVLVPIGLFWYGWSAQARVHWIMPNIGAAIFSAGIIVGFQCIQTYIVDSYARYAASAVAAAAVLRSLAGFGFPLFAPTMYNALGYGWGNSLLGFIALALGLPAPFLFWKYGEALRARSRFAAGG